MAQTLAPRPERRAEHGQVPYARAPAQQGDAQRIRQRAARDRPIASLAAGPAARRHPSAIRNATLRSPARSMAPSRPVGRRLYGGPAGRHIVGGAGHGGRDRTGSGRGPWEPAILGMRGGRADPCHRAPHSPPQCAGMRAFEHRWRRRRGRRGQRGFGRGGSTDGARARRFGAVVSAAVLAARCSSVAAPALWRAAGRVRRKCPTPSAPRAPLRAAKRHASGRQPRAPKTAQPPGRSAEPGISSAPVAGKAAGRPTST